MYGAFIWKSLYDTGSYQRFGGPAAASTFWVVSTQKTTIAAIVINVAADSLQMPNPSNRVWWSVRWLKHSDSACVDALSRSPTITELHLLNRSQHESVLLLHIAPDKRPDVWTSHIPAAVSSAVTKHLSHIRETPESAAHRLSNQIIKHEMWSLSLPVSQYTL
jgi:hypothetical protein